MITAENDFLRHYSPELHWIGNRKFPVDRYGCPYIPLSSEICTPLPYNPYRPGEGILIHEMNTKKHVDHGTIDKQLASITGYGFVTPRRFATFSTLPAQWFLQGGSAILLYRSYDCWSKEYDRPDEYTSWRESLIGIPIQAIETLAPKARAYHVSSPQNWTQN